MSRNSNGSRTDGAYGADNRKDREMATDPRLVIREVPESTQRENWQGLALFVQLPLITTKGTEWLERRITQRETAQKNPAKPMQEGQEWATENGYHLVRGWLGEDGLLVAPLQAEPRKRGDIENPPIEGPRRPLVDSPRA